MACSVAAGRDRVHVALPLLSPPSSPCLLNISLPLLKKTKIDVEVHTITGLKPETEYEVQVCRANGSTLQSDKCGNCLLCITTSFPEGQLTDIHACTYALIIVDS